MIEVNLSKALCKYLKGALANLNAVEPEKQNQPPPGSLNTRMMLNTLMQEEEETNPEVKVFNGYVPPKDKDDSQFPYVSVILVSGTMEPSSACTCKTVIDCGVYAKDHQGHVDLMNLVRRISNALLTIPDLTLDQRYVLKPPLSWAISPEDLDPYWHGSITVEWQFYAPCPAFNYLTNG